MAKKKRHHKKPMMKIPLLPVVAAAVGLGNVHRAGTQRIHGQEGYIGNAGVEASRIYMGFDSRIGADPKWDTSWLWEGTFPLLIAGVMSKAASKLGLNRMFKGLPIKL